MLPCTKPFLDKNESYSSEKNFEKIDNTYSRPIFTEVLKMRYLEQDVLTWVLLISEVAFSVYEAGVQYWDWTIVVSIRGEQREGPCETARPARGQKQKLTSDINLGMWTRTEMGYLVYPVGRGAGVRGYTDLSRD